MREYVLPRCGQTARVALLEASDISAVFDLETHARSSIPVDQRSEALAHGTAYFQNMLARHTGLMVGIKINDKLIAQIGVRGPSDLREAIALNVITDSQVAYTHAALTESVVTFSDVAIDASYANEGLLQELIAYAASLPLSQMADHIFTQVAARNTLLLKGYLAEGFAIVAAANGANDGLPRFILQKPAFGFDFSPTVIADDVDPLEDFSAIINLTQRDALVGLYEQHSPSKLAFFRSRDVLHIMPTLAKVTSRR